MNQAQAHSRFTPAGEKSELTVTSADGDTLRLNGALTVKTPASVWLEAEKRLGGRRLGFDLSGLTALDLNGAAQLFAFSAKAEKAGLEVSFSGVPASLAAILGLARTALDDAKTAAPPAKSGFFEEIGRNVIAIKDDLAVLITFAGELIVNFIAALRHPSKIRWASVFSIAETAGVNAVPIVCLVSMLVGLIIAFQSAMALQMFGLTIFVADMVGIAVVRELGPLITAIVLAGRSGSAFSAELGAMRAAEEVDAITTMGLSPVRELALPRVLASVITAPLVTLLASFMGILGGGLVLMAMGFSLLIYWQEAISLVSPATFYICIFKSILFGFVVAAIGCQKGLAAGDGPGAVGEATTSGVVTNIVAIAILDSLLAILFYVWDI